MFIINAASSLIAVYRASESEFSLSINLAAAARKRRRKTQEQNADCAASRPDVSLSSVILSVKGIASCSTRIDRRICRFDFALTACGAKIRSISASFFTCRSLAGRESLPQIAARQPHCVFRRRKNGQDVRDASLDGQAQRTTTWKKPRHRRKKNERSERKRAEEGQKASAFQGK